MNDHERAVKALLGGQAVLIPTDTVYGLAARAADADAVAAIFDLKRRPVDARLAVLVADVDQARRHVDLGVSGEILAAAFWPGPLTIVARRIDGGGLVAGDHLTLGVRCPDDDFVRELAATTGPLAATSANLSGEATPVEAAEAAAVFPTVEVVIDGGARTGVGSTVVSVVGPELEVLRLGAITATDIEAAATRDF